MSDAFPLALYRAATRLVEPVAPALLRWRLRRGKEDPVRRGERLGRPGLARPAGAVVWAHGASVGEGIALLPLIEELARRGIHVLLTTGTVASARVLAGRLPAGAMHQFVPLDLPGAARRFFDHWRPDIVCFAESELWPNLLGEARRRTIPAVLVNARMSTRSYARWQRFPAAVAPLFRSLAMVLAQTEADARRYAALGAERVTNTGNLKFDVPPPSADSAELAAVRAMIAGRPVWVAASTHPGEDEFCCAIHARLAARHPGLLTILVPRKPDRGPEIAAAATAQGLRVGLRSRGATPEPELDVYVADTMGELGLFYRIAPIVFVGKSLAGGGGQNPIEAVKLGAAVLHGRSVANFDEVYALLDAEGGSLVVSDADELGHTLDGLLAKAGAAAAIAEHGWRIVEAQQGAAARTMAALEPLLSGIPATSR